MRGTVAAREVTVPAREVTVPADAAEVLASIVQHRLLTASQVHELCLPAKSLRTAQLVLTILARAGLVSHVRSGPGQAAWYATDAGARAVNAEVVGRSRWRSRVTAAAAAGPLRAHTMAINDVGLSFVRAARQLGHECYPADWEHEVALRMSDRAKAGQGSDMLVVDAVLHYTRRFAEGDEVMVRFVELDRGTETMQRLTAKLLAYRQLYSYRPKAGTGWRDRYLVFPKVLVVLSGRLSLSQLERRRLTFLQLADQAGVAETITAMVTTLPELEERGPFSPIFWTVGADAQPVDFAGEIPDPGVPTGPVNAYGRRGRQLRLVQPAVGNHSLEARR